VQAEEEESRGPLSAGEPQGVSSHPGAGTAPHIQ